MVNRNRTQRTDGLQVDTRRATEEKTGRPGSDGFGFHSADDRWDLLILIGASFFGPLMVWANSSEQAGPLGFFLLGLLLLAVAVSARGLIIQRGFDRHGVSYSLAVLIFGFSNAGVLLDRGIPRLILAFAVLAAAVITYRLRDMGVIRAAVLWGGLFVVAYPFLIWATQNASFGSEGEPAPNRLDAAMIEGQRDIVLIVLDGYANSSVLRELYDYDNTLFEGQLMGEGFDVTSGSVSNYGLTRFSVASVVQLDYPVTAGPFAQSDFDDLLQIIGGDNTLASWLTDLGYTHTYVESGWFGTRCKTTVDRCVEGPWPNESFYDVTNRSLLKDLPGLETGRSFSRGSQRVLEWLQDDLEPLLRNDQPDFVHAHVLAPHPPLFLDSQCAMHAQDGVKGFHVGTPSMTDAELERARHWYISQIECVNSVLLEVAEVASQNDAIVLMFGDHGSDSQSQLFLLGTEWTEEQLWERHGVMAAARVPGCDMSHVESLVNLGRRMVSCISDQRLPDLPTKVFGSDRTPQGDRMVELPVPIYQGGS